MKLNDVYRFQWSPEALKESRTDLNWCFDGKLTVKARDDGSLFLHDSYWGHSGGRILTPEEAETKGSLTFICNLDEVEPIPLGEEDYYATPDVFNLTSHAGHRKAFMRRKGAKRDRAAMIRHLRAQQHQARQEADSAIRNLEWIAREIHRVETATDLDALCI